MNAMSFRATEFEFRHRVWFIAGIFCVGFLCYGADHVNVSAALSKMIRGSGGSHNLKEMDAWMRAFFIFAAFLAACAALVRTWASAFLHSSVVYDSNLHLDRLVADGPYRHLRNPLYLGTVLLSAGIGFLASRTGILILVGGITIFVYRLILREEAGLLEAQGEAYRRYFESVPRFAPSLRPRVASAGARPDWIDGFTGEVFFWGCAVGMALFAATGNILYYLTALGTGFAVRFLKTFTQKKSNNRGRPTR
jgi:protein-S-isoprenylcysteine O-methyltransferase Ste14